MNSEAQFGTASQFIGSSSSGLMGGPGSGLTGGSSSSDFSASDTKSISSGLSRGRFALGGTVIKNNKNNKFKL